MASDRRALAVLSRRFLAGEKLSRGQASGGSGSGMAAVRQSGADSRWAEYERAKSTWLHLNPDATAEEVGKAFRQIARDLGL